jgi:predicted nucleic acid-binding protein
MVIVDTSVWINHFRRGNAALTSLLNDGKVVIHEFIIGELACSNFKQYEQIIKLLMNLHRTKKVTIEEYLLFIEKNKLNGTGIGFVDIHLLASSKLSGYPLFTYDKKLSNAAKVLTLEYN